MKRCAISALLSAIAFASPSQAEPFEQFQDCDACPVMIELPLGKFTMGAPLEESAFLHSLWFKPENGEPLGLTSEGPQHQVTIDIPIAMGRDEITRAEWFACVDAGGCSHEPSALIRTADGHVYTDDPRHPIMNVSFLDMQEYVAWLNDVTGTDAYRLPTEAEWEYAARAGTTTKFGQGEELTPDIANIGIFRQVSDRRIGDDANRPVTVLVDDLDAANPWGLRHMAGNVIERTMSCWSERHLGLPTSSAYLSNAIEQPVCNRIAKGGAYGASQEYARPANRGSSPQDSRTPSSGFRIVKTLTPSD